MAERYWPGEDPLDRRVKLAMDPADTTAPWMTVVGVVGNVRPALSVPPQPAMHLPLSQIPWSSMSLVVRTAAADPGRIVPAVRREVAALDSDLPLGNVQTMEAIVERSVAEPRFRTVLLGGFGLLALALAAIGIYGVVSFGVARRVQEMGVRMALGATPGDVRGLMIGQGLRPVLFGLALGLAAALAVMRVLGGFLYGVQPWDPLTFIVTPLLLLSVGVLAVWLPARRAARVDPVEALRYE